MIQLIFWVIVICVAIAYWQWAIGLAVVWVAFQVWRLSRTDSSSGKQPNAPLIGNYQPPTNTGNPETEKRLRQSYKQFLRSSDPDILDDIPCKELYTLSEQDEPYNWPERWVQMDGKLYAGRMIARKDSRIWTALSCFDLPYPPFDHNSGMWTREVFRGEAEDLGIVTRKLMEKLK